MRDVVVWKPIIGLETLYEISNTGLVKSCRHYGWDGKVGILTPRWSSINKRNKGRYASVRLIDKSRGIDVQYLIHRLVAEAFLPNPQNKSEVNHLDGNTENNHVSNLEWVTPGENHQHAYDNGLSTIEAAQLARTNQAHKYDWVNEDGQSFYGTVQELIAYDSAIPSEAFSLLHKVNNSKSIYRHYKYGYGWRINWPPGSDGAISKFSCSCAVLDNRHGAGAYEVNGKPVFWVSGDCPLHGIGKTDCTLKRQADL